MSDTTDVAAHASAIRKIASHWATFFGPFIHNDNLWYTDTFMDGKDAGEIGSDMTEVKRHAAALDAARVAAEQRGRFARLVEAERDYQREKWGANDNVHTWPEWGAILGEEFGEVCRALKDVHWQGARSDAAGRHGLRGELVQLAAICAAMIERIDAEPAPGRADGGEAASLT